MLVSRHREKLINAIIYFVTNTKYCGTTKLFKLLNFLDFMHFRQTGKSVTGLDYYAWLKGPVPADLFFEIKRDPGKDLVAALLFNEIKEDSGKNPTKISAKQKFNDLFFTRRELEILSVLAEIYAECPAEDIVEISHLKNGPWDQTLKTKGEKKRIDYLLAADGKTGDQLDIDNLKMRIKEMQETRAALK